MGNEKKATLRLVIAGDPSGGSSALRTVGVDASNLTGKMKNLALAGGAVYAGRQLVAWGQQAVATYRRVGGEMLKLTRFTGLAEEQVSGLWVAAQQSGVPMEKLTASIGIFQTKLQTGKLDKLGLGLTDATGKALPFDQALRKIADRFQSMTDAGEKVNLSRQLFGRGGADLIPLLSKGGDALDDYIAKAEELGLTLNSDDIKEATKNQREFALASTAAGFVIGKEVLPAVTSFTSFAARNLPPLVGMIADIVHMAQALPGPVKLAMGAFLLAGPAAKVVGMLATPLKLTLGLMASGRQAAGMFQLGLAGVTEKGAGAANALGGLMSTAGTMPLVMGAAAAGIGVLVAAFLAGQAQSRNLEADVASLQEEMEATGKTAVEVFKEKLANNIAGTEGGFSLRGTGDRFRIQLEAAGIGATELATALTGTNAQYQALIDKANEKLDAGSAAILTYNLENLRTSGRKAADQQVALTEANAELGNVTDDTAGSMDEAAGSTDTWADALKRANDAVQGQVDKAKQISDAQDAVAAAHNETTAAQDELAAARRAAAGDSDEYRDAEQNVADAEESVQDAQQGVIDAQNSVAESQRDLTAAREDAIDRLREMAQATRDAVLAEADANLRVKEARKELERVNADPRSTALEKERAALEVRKAEEEARQAGEDSRAQQSDNARAQAAGVEGDAGVVRAKAAVAAASRKVIDAERDLAAARRDVAAAEVARTQVLVNAKADVEAAIKKVEDATFKEAEAWFTLVTAQHGAITGVAKYREVLRQLTADLDPNAPLALRIAALMEALGLASDAGGYGVTGTIGAVDPDGPGPRGGTGGDTGDDPGPGTGGDSLSDGRSGNTIINQTLQGTPRQARRAAATAATDVLDRTTRDTR